MTTATDTPARRPRLKRLALLALLAVAATACTGTWGIRTSYRNYVTGPIGGGSISTAGDVVWLDGPGTGKGPFRWPIATATFNPTTKKGRVEYRGSVRTAAHATPAGHVLDLSVSNPRLDIDGPLGLLYVDLVFRPYVGTSPPSLPPLQTALDVPFAAVNLAGVSWVQDSGGNYVITNAPMVGLPAAMDLIGWDEFYGSPVTLDPFTTAFNPAYFPPPSP